jgi:hypothetical protein
MAVMEDYWHEVKEQLEYAKCIAFDGCHKIYLALDETQAQWFRENYEHTQTAYPDVMLATLEKWYEDSCPLKFISAVETNEADPNEGFTSLIPQGAEDEAREEEEWEEEYALWRKLTSSVPSPTMWSQSKSQFGKTTTTPGWKYPTTK